MEVKPAGDNGERWVLTSVCVHTKYPFLRVTHTRDSPFLAELMLDIILDCGVVPRVLQSDNEFCSLAFEELTTLLGSSQMFGTALRPQPQGVVERSHDDIRKGLAILVETLARAVPRSWPRYVRYLEAKARHKRMGPKGESPYSAVHGFLVLRH